MINETPYSVQICLRKRYVKEFKESLHSLSTDHGENVQVQNQLEKETLTNKLSTIQKMLEESEAKNNAAKDTIAVLEEKVKKSESDLYDFIAKNKKCLEEKIEEIKVLKGVIKNQGVELSRNKNEATKIAKIIKSKEKEVYSLGSTIENQVECIKNLKETSRNLKSDKTKLEKAMKKNEKNAIKKKAVKHLSSPTISIEPDENSNTKSFVTDLETNNFFDPLSEIANFKCDTCAYVSDSEASLKVHISEAHDTLTKVFTIPITATPTNTPTLVTTVVPLASQCSPDPRTPPCSPPRTPQGSPSSSSPTPPPSKPTQSSTSPRTPPCSPSPRTPQGSPQLIDEAEVENNVFDLSAEEFGQLLSGIISKYTSK